MMQHKNKWLPWFTVLAATLLLAACAPIRALRGSGQVVTQEFAFADFEQVDVSSAFQVTIRQGAGYQVTIAVDEVAVPHLRITKEGNTLQIGLEPGFHLLGDMTLRGEVTLPALRGLTASGASQVDLSRFASTNDLELRVTGASRVRGEIDSGDAAISAAGASTITLSGTMQEVTIEATGASKVTLHGAGQNVTVNAAGASPVDLGEFPVADASVKASGASNVTVQPSGTLDVDASGASAVYYIGSPTMGNIQMTGASTVNRR